MAARLCFPPPTPPPPLSSRTSPTKIFPISMSFLSPPRFRSAAQRRIPRAAAPSLSVDSRTSGEESLGISLPRILLDVKDLRVIVAESKQEILRGVNLTVNEGEIHAIMGKNGSGKSTLSKVLVGHPDYEVIGGAVLFKGENLLDMKPEERSHAGLFMSFQTPVEIPGVSNMDFLRMACNARREKRGEPAFSPIEFFGFLAPKLAAVKMNPKFLDRNVNEGFSGGEKKRNEILQLVVLEAELAILDEIDSGLDVDALQDIAEAVNTLLTPHNSILMITHYQRLLDYIKPSYVHIMAIRRTPLLFFLALYSSLLLLPRPASAELRQNYYADVCPDVETIVRHAVAGKFKETFVTVPGTLRLFAHDCFVQGCDASIMVVSTEGNKAEKDHPDNLSLAGDGFDTVIRAKTAVDAVPQCRNKVSCADILIMATRDVVALVGGPSYEVELGRLDGLSSTMDSVDGKLPKASSNLDELNSIFAKLGLSQDDMIALSGAHTLGFSHCSDFANRIRNFSKESQVDGTLNRTYAAELQATCPPNVDPTLVASLDPVTSMWFDNQYFINLQLGMGLLTSDQTLFTDTRSRHTVDAFARDSELFNKNFVLAMTRMGRVGAKTEPGQGNIRKDCSVFN